MGFGNPLQYHQWGQMVASQPKPPGLVPPQTTPATDSGRTLAQSYSPQFFANLRSGIGAAPTAVPTVPYMPDNYYTTQRDILKNQLNDQFFGPTGTVQQVASGEAAGGRLGSGVGQQIIQEAAIKPYTQAMTAADQGITAQQLQERQQTNAQNAQIGQGNATLQAQYQDLIGRLGQAEAGTMSQEDIAQLEADTRLFEANMNAKTAAASNANQSQQNEITYLNTLGQFKGLQGSPFAEQLANQFGSTSQAPNFNQTQVTGGGAPQAGGAYVGQASPDGRYIWAMGDRGYQWMPNYAGPMTGMENR